MKPTGKDMKSTSRGRILPNSIADVEAALAAVRVRTAKLKLQSPENVFHTIRPLVDEERQPSSYGSGEKASIESMGPSNLNSVKASLRQHNSEHTGVVPVRDNSNMHAYDYDSDDSSDDSYGVSGVNLQDISDMIDRVQMKNSTSIQKPKNDNLKDISDMIDRVQMKNSSKTQHTHSGTLEGDSQVPPNQTHFHSINEMIDRVNQRNPTAVKKQSIQIIQSSSSDISSDDSLDIPDVPATTQVNLALYIDSLNVSKQKESVELSGPSSQHVGLTGSNTSPLTESPVHLANHESENKTNADIYRVTVPQTVNVELSRCRSNLQDSQEQQKQDVFKTESKSAIPSLQTNKHRASRNEAATTQIFSSCNKAKLKSYIDKAKEIMKKPVPTLAEIEYIIIYARRDNVPIKPILRALDSNSTSLGLTKHTERHCDHTPSSVTRHDIERFIFYLNESVYHVENNYLSSTEIKDLLNRAAHDNVDDTLVRQILENPTKHVKYEESWKEAEAVMILPDDFKKIEAKQYNLNFFQSNNSLINVEPNRHEYDEGAQMPAQYGGNAKEIQNENAGVAVESDRKRSGEDKEFVEIEFESSTSSNNYENSAEDDCSQVVEFNESDQKSSAASSDSSLPSRSGTANSAPSVIGTHLRDPSSSQTQSDHHDFDLLVNSVSSDKNLNESEKFLYYKIKQFNKAKQFAEVKNNNDGNRATSTFNAPELCPVLATKRLFTRRMFKGFHCATIYRSTKQWKITPNERIVGRPGYEGIHVESYHEATRVDTDSINSIDVFSWEKRDVKQLFLDEADITRANWFGSINTIRMNKRVVDQLIHPKSVMMKVVTYPEKWKLDWYTTWYTKKHNPNKDEDKKRERARIRARKSKKNKNKKHSRRSRKYDDKECEEKNDIPEIPEIGHIYTLRFRGEKASLVHLNFTSYLSQSRWKKKYFPKGIFSTD